MRKILLLIIFIMILSMTSCSGVPNAFSASEVTSSSSITDEFTRPGYAVETDGYTFFTDFKSVYKMKNQTGEITKIYTSGDDILCIFEYMGYIFVQLHDTMVNRMDYDGNNISTIKDINIIFGANGYIYYQDGGNIKRRSVSGEKDELISNWYDETNGANDIGFWSDYIGYYNGKVYFQENHKIYNLSTDGVKTYYCDGDFHSMKGSILILNKDKEFYRKDVETGDEFKVYSYKGIYDYEEYVNGEYVGKYKGNEYYLMDGKILLIHTDGNKITAQEKLPFEYVEYAIVSNEWIYINSLDENPGFLRYNIVTKQKESIAAFPTMAPGKPVTECNNHLYYVEDNENGLFQIDLNDNSCKQIYSGKMYVYHLYI